MLHTASLSITTSHMFAATLFAWSDDGIGKSNRAKASQQTLTELSIFGLANTEEICGSRDAAGEVCTWKRHTVQR